MDRNSATCKICWDAGEAEMSGTHMTKDETGRVQCPILRANTCTNPNCFNHEVVRNPDMGHTIKYCPCPWPVEMQAGGPLEHMKYLKGAVTAQAMAPPPPPAYGTVDISTGNVFTHLGWVPFGMVIQTDIGPLLTTPQGLFQAPIVPVAAPAHVEEMPADGEQVCIHSRKRMRMDISKTPRDGEEEVPEESHKRQAVDVERLSEMDPQGDAELTRAEILEKAQSVTPVDDDGVPISTDSLEQDGCLPDIPEGTRRLTGTLAHWDGERNFGFMMTPNGREVWFSGDQVWHLGEHPVLNHGDELSFSISRNKSRFRSGVVCMDITTKDGRYVPSSDEAMKSKRGVVTRKSKVYRGEVKVFQNGHGWIKDTKGDEIFVHWSDIDGLKGFKSLSAGQEVEFEAEKNEKGEWRAVRVTAPGNAPLRRSKPSQDEAAAAESTPEVEDVDQGSETDFPALPTAEVPLTPVSPPHTPPPSDDEDADGDDSEVTFHVEVDMTDITPRSVADGLEIDFDNLDINVQEMDGVEYNTLALQRDSDTLDLQRHFDTLALQRDFREDD